MSKVSTFSSSKSIDFSFAREKEILIDRSVVNKDTSSGFRVVHARTEPTEPERERECERKKLVGVARGEGADPFRDVNESES